MAVFEASRPRRLSDTQHRQKGPETQSSAIITNIMRHDSYYYCLCGRSTRDFLVSGVTDNVPGIKEKYFPFFADAAPKDDYKNTGIGLVTVKKIVSSRGGRVWRVRSGPGKYLLCHIAQ